MASDVVGVVFGLLALIALAWSLLHVPSEEFREADRRVKALGLMATWHCPNVGTKGDEDR